MKTKRRRVLIAIILTGAVISVAVFLRVTFPQATVVPAATTIKKPILQTRDEIDRLMNRIVQGDFPEGLVTWSGGGWGLMLPDGSPMDRDGLRTVFAAPVIDCGADAVPHLFKWVMHDNLAIRYVAAYSLEQITGIESNIFWFDKEDAGHNREAAITRWRQWWDSRPD